MASVARLYTPEILALSTELAALPLDPAMARKGEARSQSCGSRVTMSLDADASGRIARLGLNAQACAIGQASAALFARAAIGRTRDDIAGALAALEQWLAGKGPLPDWPGIAVIAPAAAYPARHGAILLAWRAALAALAADPLPRA